MQISLHRGPPTATLLEGRGKDITPEPQQYHSRLCVVGGGLSRERLQNKLAREGQPPSSVADYTTVDDISEQLLSSGLDGKSPLLLPDSFVQRLLQETLRRADNGEYTQEVQELANHLPLEEDEAVETLYDELDDFYRGTDAGNDTQELKQLARDLDNTYARESSTERLEQFAALTDLLEELVTDIVTEEGEESSIEPFLSRSHFVSAAREYVETDWEAVFGDVSWVGITTISIFDNPTLRLLLEIGRQNLDVDLHFFLGPGSYQRQRDRLESLDDVSVDGVDDSPRDFDSPAGQTLFKVVSGEQEEIPQELAFVSAPERRREIENLAQDVRQRISNGTSPGDIVITARNTEQYQTHIEDIFESNNIPYHMEAKEPLAYAPSYRFLTSVFQLIQDASDNEELSYEDLLDPLRLGFVLPPGDRRYWPLDDSIFLHLEQRLHDVEEQHGKRTFGEWQGTVSNLSGWDLPRELMESYLEWVADQRSSPPQNGAELRSLIRELVSDFIYQMVPQHRSRQDGPGIEGTRTRITERHSTAVAEEVFKSAVQVGTHYNYLNAIFGDENWSPSWEEVAQALNDVVGGNSIRQQQKDGSAVRIVDAGDSFFMDAEHIHILGLSRGDFPTEREEAAFIHEGLRDAVAQAAEAGEYPYLRLAAQRTQYNVDLDYYDLALRVSTESVTVSRRYRDTEGNSVPWSAFVDLVDTDPDNNYANKLRADQWLPEPNGDNDDWERLGARIGERDRLRLLQFHANRDWPTLTAPTIQPDDIESIGAFTDLDAYSLDIRPRHNRFLEPPLSVSIDSDEPAFADADIDDIIGSPIGVHELDLFSQCQLKFYFYQFLYNFDGEETERYQIPFYSANRTNYRIGSVPHVVRHHYAGSHTREVWEEIIERSELRDRRALTEMFDSRAEVREWMREEYGTYADWKIGPQLADEYTLVSQEEESEEQFDRQWSWQGETTVDVDEDGTEVWMPGHRRDILRNDDDYILSLFHVRHSSYARKATKMCWRSREQQYRDEDCGSLCGSCGNNENCTYSTKFMLDHRIHVLPHAEEDNAGFVFHDHVDSGSDARHGLVKRHHADEFRDGLEGGPEANLDAISSRLPRGGWYQREGYWKDDLEDHIESFTPSDGETEFEVDRRFVDQGGCESCIYRSMCGVPNGGTI